MAEQHSNMVINYVVNEAESGGPVQVGITDVKRWNHELNLKHSGSSAKTLAFWESRELRENGTVFAPVETITFFLSEDDPLRESVFKALFEVARIGWLIRTGKMSSDQAFGTIL